LADKQSSTADDLVFEKLENLAKHYNWLIRAQVILRKKSSDGKENM
jgi:putative sigma-54 modulation protein